jgi:hypothetical protein
LDGRQRLRPFVALEYDVATIEDLLEAPETETELVTLKQTKPYLVIKKKGAKQYLRRDVYKAMKEDEKWKPLSWADRFLTSDSAERFARRMLGNEDFEIIEVQWEVNG